MLRVLKSLLVLLIVATFGVAAIRPATALPCVGHPVERTTRDQLSRDCRPVAAAVINHSAPHHKSDGKCVSPCCTASATAALPNVLRPYVPSRIAHKGFAIPNDYALTGIDVMPLIGPPKLSA